MLLRAHCPPASYPIKLSPYGFFLFLKFAKLGLHSESLFFYASLFTSICSGTASPFRNLNRNAVLHWSLVTQVWADSSYPQLTLKSSHCILPVPIALHKGIFMWMYRTSSASPSLLFFFTFASPPPHCTPYFLTQYSFCLHLVYSYIRMDMILCIYLKSSDHMWQKHGISSSLSETSLIHLIRLSIFLQTTLFFMAGECSRVRTHFHFPIPPMLYAEVGSTAWLLWMAQQ